jgi:hypothetical protein
MTPTLIVLGLLVLGVAIVVFATRQRGTGAARPVDPKTGWDAPISPADSSVAGPDLTLTGPDAATAEPRQDEKARP